MATTAERVARGAAWLDEHETGWWQRIDIARLDLSSSCQCVLGQLSADLVKDTTGDRWVSICQLFGIAWGRGSRSRPSDTALGFALPAGRRSAGYKSWENLTMEWRREIVRRWQSVL